MLGLRVDSMNGLFEACILMPICNDVKLGWRHQIRLSQSPDII